MGDISSSVSLETHCLIPLNVMEANQRAGTLQHPALCTLQHPALCTLQHPALCTLQHPAAPYSASSTVYGMKLPVPCVFPRTAGSPPLWAWPDCHSCHVPVALQGLTRSGGADSQLREGRSKSDDLNLSRLSTVVLLRDVLTVCYYACCMVSSCVQYAVWYTTTLLATLSMHRVLQSQRSAHGPRL